MKGNRRSVSNKTTGAIRAVPNRCASAAPASASLDANSSRESGTSKNIRVSKDANSSTATGASKDIRACGSPVTSPTLHIPSFRRNVSADPRVFHAGIYDDRGILTAAIYMGVAMPSMSRYGTQVFALRIESLRANSIRKLMPYIHWKLTGAMSKHGTPSQDIRKAPISTSSQDIRKAPVETLYHGSRVINIESAQEGIIGKIFVGVLETQSWIESVLGAEFDYHIGECNCVHDPDLKKYHLAYGEHRSLGFGPEFYDLATGAPIDRR